MIGKTISHYKVLEKIGEGRMGVVYKAQDTKLKRTVALKFLPSEFTKDKEAKERFIQEAQAAAALDHPHICTVHEIDEVEGQTFISMAYIDGQSLKERIKSGPMEFREALDIAVQVAEGLLVALGRVFLQRLLYNFLQFLRQFFSQTCDRLRLLMQNLINCGLIRMTLEWTLSSQHFVHHRPKRPDICAVVNLFAFRLFGRHVGHGTHDRGCFGQINSPFQLG